MDRQIWNRIRPACAEAVKTVRKWILVEARVSFFLFHIIRSDTVDEVQSTPYISSILVYFTVPDIGSLYILYRYVERLRPLSDGLNLSSALLSLVWQELHKGCISTLENPSESVS